MVLWSLNARRVGIYLKFVPGIFVHVTSFPQIFLPTFFFCQKDQIFLPKHLFKHKTMLVQNIIETDFLDIIFGIINFS